MKKLPTTVFMFLLIGSLGSVSAEIMELRYSTYLGTEFEEGDYGPAVAIDSLGAAYLTGSTIANIAFPTADIAPRAAGYGIPGHIVDGQDVLAVREVAGEAVERARGGAGPTLIEAKTYRYGGHCGASAGHQNPEECAEWRKRDPIGLFERRLADEGVLTEEERSRLLEEARAEIDAAERFAMDSPLPAAAALTDLRG